jgi:hypothetical protein
MLNLNQSQECMDDVVPRDTRLSMEAAGPFFRRNQLLSNNNGKTSYVATPVYPQPSRIAGECPTNTPCVVINLSITPFDDILIKNRPHQI